SIFAADEASEPARPADPQVEAPVAEVTQEALPADPRQAAEAASVDEWDPFGNEFAAEVKQGDAEEDLPWLEGIDEAARGGWTPPAADEGLAFLREIEASTRGGAATPPASADLGADDLAFLEELDRAIGSGPAAGGGARTPATPPAQPAAGAPAGGAPSGGAPAAGSRAEPLLCKECGAINEPHSWYCEICGSEL
ncbi:MAG TPA: Ran-binding zinc finger domain-containing protein, partial [Longimicrobium sp.]|nr:Ran-binding zinc finger domain-containing protein [Longimicrobium sp.]